MTMRTLCLSAAAGLWAAAAALPALAADPPDSKSRAALPLDELADIRAGQESTVDVLSNQQLTATNSGNTIVAGAVRSGDVVFSGAALSNFNGVGNFVVNTGANNNLQGAINLTIVNVPPGR